MNNQPAIKAQTPLVLTVGHSTRSLEDFIKLLRVHGVGYLLDVRTVPRSRHNPQFNLDSLPKELEAAGIGYGHSTALGGLRKARHDSPNTGWRNKSFQGYADYMLTPDFEAGLRQLIDLAGHRQVAIMCAEAVPWRCHRSLIADAMILKGWQVRDILSAAPAKEHKLTPFLKVINNQPTYPNPDDPATLFDQPR
jgi:uncharacterized protein (DUF488 family)